MFAGKEKGKNENKKTQLHQEKGERGGGGGGLREGGSRSRPRRRGRRADVGRRGPTTRRMNEDPLAGFRRAAAVRASKKVPRK